MTKPPFSPLRTSKGQQISYFEFLIAKTYKYLREEGIQLSLKGYKEILMEYANLNEEDSEKAWTLTKELNAWAEYFSSIANLVQKMYLDSETEKIQIQSISSIEADDSNVSNGNRMSNRDERVVEARKKRNALKALYDELEAKVKFLERAYYHCKMTYESNHMLSHKNES